MPKQFYEFGPYRIDRETRMLLGSNGPVHLTPTEFDTLWALVTRRGTQIGKDLLFQEIWKEHVGSDNLRAVVTRLNRKLGKDAHGQHYIRTVRQGYYQLFGGPEESESSQTQAADRPPGADSGGRAEELAEFAAELGARRVKGAAEIVDVGVGRVEQPAETLRRRFPRKLAFGVSAAIVLAAILFPPSRLQRPVAATPARTGRLLLVSSSDSRVPLRIPLDHGPHFLAVSPDGTKLFVAENRGKALSIIDTRDGKVRSIPLASPAGPLAVSAQGVLYVGSRVEGIMVLDTTKELLLGTIPTGGPVQAMALTPDGEKLFLAMRQFGLKRLQTGSRKLDQISDRVCPEHLAVDPAGTSLYVGYECQGPGGRPGHDSVEVFDAVKEVSVATVTGRPMVGGAPTFSLDGKLVLLNGADACWNPEYDHEGCSSVPSQVVYLLRASDRTLLHTFEFPGRANGHPHFLDNSRFVMLGNPTQIIDAAKYSVLEKWDFQSVSFALARDGRRAYLGADPGQSVVFIDRESSDCNPPQPGLAILYAADGTTDDSAGLTALRSQGRLQFAPGRVGQAFAFDGSNLLSTSWTGDYQFGRYDESTFVLYGRFADSLPNEMILMDWASRDLQRGVQLLKSTNNHIVFRKWPDGNTLMSKLPIKPDLWYHVAVTWSDKEVALYVNGKRDASVSSFARLYPPLLEPSLFFGGNRSQGPSFRGLLDEIGFYDRALSAEEVREVYQRRESGKCKLLEE